MKSRWVTWAVAVAGAVALAAWVMLAVRGNRPSDVQGWLNLVGIISFAVGFGSVGLVLALRRPDHPVGWLSLAFGTVAATRLALEEIARVADGGVAAWSSFGVNALAVLMLAILIALAIAFPNGWPTTRPWRAALWVLVAASIAGFLIAPFVEYEGEGYVLRAPLVRIRALDGVEFFLAMVIFAIGFLALIRLVLLLFRGDPVVKHQIRWVAYTVVLSIVVLTLDLWFPGANVVAGVIAGFGIPLSLAVAITRYRLYDIDRVMNRTVVYAIVVGLLAAVFAVGAVVIPSLLPLEENNLAVAASTLVVFFLFNPMRKRVQRLVDRRFFRSRYDAQQVADEFSARLRDQVDPDVVAAEWVDVVRRTMQPESVAVWVRD